MDEKSNFLETDFDSEVIRNISTNIEIFFYFESLRFEIKPAERERERVTK